MADPAPRARRDLDLIPIRHQDKPYVLVNDELGLAGEGTLIPWGLYEFMALLDGKNSLRDIQFTMMRQRGGALVGLDEIERLLARLDESYLVETDRYREARAGIVAAFSENPSRRCVHCGRAYPSDPDALRHFLEGLLTSETKETSQSGKGEGRTGSPTRAPRRMVGLVAPHIDLKAGAGVYGSAYRCIRDTRPNRIILLGVGHKMQGGLFSLTEKDFETPLGSVRTDRDLVRDLRRTGKDCVMEDDFAHRSEHSLEFQAIFLRHIWEGWDFAVVPILCGSLVSELPAYNREAYLERTRPFLTALSRAMVPSQGESLLLAGVDFSHIGPKFGHETPAVHLEGRSKAHDQALLQALIHLDAEAFWQVSTQERDAYNVCGFSALACMLEVLPPSEGEVLDYRFWHEEATRSAVSFAAAAFSVPRRDPGPSPHPA